MTTTDGPGESRLPTPDEENRFWALLEAAWSQVDDTVNQTRLRMARRAPEQARYADLMVIDKAADAFLAALTGLCEAMSSEELTDLDRVLERKLHAIDREDIHEVTDGSDDGFLYARGLIVALGRAYYDAVVADPEVATADCDFEEMCYFFAHLHEKKFGSWPETGSGISRESFGNPAGWGAI